MQVQPISTFNNHNSSASVKKNPNFKTRLRLTFSPSSIPCNYNRGECNFERVISRFREWLSEQTPKTGTLTISQKEGNMVTQRKVRGAGGIFYEQHPENLEFSMDGARCGFCWNEQSGEHYALEDLKNTFNYVKGQAGW